MKGADERLREVERIAKTEVPAGVPMARWALAWCLRSPSVQCVIPRLQDRCNKWKRTRRPPSWLMIPMRGQPHEQRRLIFSLPRQAVLRYTPSGSPCCAAANHR